MLGILFAGLIAASEGHLVAGQDVEVPKKVVHVNPKYPPSGLSARLQGLVVLQVVIDTEGRPAEVTVLRGKSTFNQAAVDAVKQWRYEPTVREGVPVAVTTVEPIEFLLDDGPGIRSYGRLAKDPKEYPAVRRYAISRLQALAPRDRGEVEKTLQGLSDDPEPSVRQAVQAALISIHSRPQR
jgi:TonB family protein